MLSQEEMDPVDEREECEECDSESDDRIDDLLDPGKGAQPPQMSNSLLIYMTIKLLIDAALISLYAVQMFGMDHLDCITKGRGNITEKVKKTYRIMFWVLITDIFMLLSLTYFSQRNTFLGALGFKLIRIAEVTIGLTILGITLV